MENDPSLEFDFLLAETLGMTVGQVRDLPADEWSGWVVYLGRKAQRMEIANRR